MPPGKGVKKAGNADKRRGTTKIIAEASVEELRPTEEARQELQRLLAWEERSEKRDWVVGRPFK